MSTQVPLSRRLPLGQVQTGPLGLSRQSHSHFLRSQGLVTAREKGQHTVRHSAAPQHYSCPSPTAPSAFGSPTGGFPLHPGQREPLTPYNPNLAQSPPAPLTFSTTPS